MIDSSVALLEALRMRGLMADAAQSAQSTSRLVDRPWYIGLLLGACGWLSGLLIMVLVGMQFRPSSATAYFVIGLVLLCGALAIFLADREGAFVGQLAFSLSIAGQLSVLFGVADLLPGRTDKIATLAFVAFAMELALLVVMPNRLHRATSTLFACAAWALGVRYALWDQPPWQPMQAHAMPSLPLALTGWALAWLPPAAGLFLTIRHEDAWMARGRQPLLRPAIHGLIVALAAGTLLSEPWALLRFVDAWDEHSWLALWPLLSAVAALAALAAAFASGNAALAGICIAATVAHVAYFYYTMGASLLVKSLTLLLLGAAALVAARYVRPQNPKP